MFASKKLNNKINQVIKWTIQMSFTNNNIIKDIINWITKVNKFTVIS